MKNFKQLVRGFIQDESGQDLIEYALVAGLIGLGAIVAIGTLGNTITSVFDKVNSSLTSSM